MRVSQEPAWLYKKANIVFNPEHQICLRRPREEIGAKNFHVQAEKQKSKGCNCSEQC
jgi:hypothetical protein